MAADSAVSSAFVDDWRLEMLRLQFRDTLIKPSDASFNLLGCQHLFGK
jgi:hypothetical protein